MLASGVVLGTVAGLLVARSWRPLASIQVRWLPLLLLALLIRTGALLAGDLGLPLYISAIAATAFVALVNLQLPGAALIAIGGMLNLIVVLANGGMPFDPAAVAAVGGAVPRDRLHVVLSGTSHFSFLADVIPMPPFRGAYSLGDVLIAIGGFLVPFVRSIRR